MSHPYPLPADVVLNKQYRIVRILGSGGFGITYLAEDIHLRELFAVKEYFPNASAVRHADNSLNIHKDDKASFQEGLHYFYNEARKAKKLNHPNIVQIAALFEENNTAYLVMPYLHGETLRAWLERHPQPELADLQNIFLPLLDALAYMHRAEIEFYDERRKQKVSATGVLHLDIKPDNILLAQTQAGQTPMLIDFGAARHSTKSHGYAFRSNSFPQFTLNYAAGEHGTPRISPATDIYSLSACLYEAVSGCIPESAAARMDKDDRLSARSDYCRRYPKAWLKVIDKGFDLYQQNRYQSADEMRQALIKASGQNTESSPKGGKGRLLALWAGIGAGAVLGWGIYQYNGASDEPYLEPVPPPASAAADPDAAALLAKEIAAKTKSPPPRPDAAEIKSLYKQAEKCKVVITGSDAMRFDQKEISIKSSCKYFTVVLKHTGKMPKAVMGHNVVISKAADKYEILEDGIGVGLDKDYLKPNDKRVVAATKMIGGGEEDTVVFTVSRLVKGEDYAFYCTFPGHSPLMSGIVKLVD